MNAISLELLNQSTSNLVYDVIPPKGRTLLILGHLRKLRWPPSNFLICMLWTPLVNAISLEPLHQLTSILVYDVIPPNERTLLIFWAICLKQDGGHQTVKIYAIDIPLVNAISLESFHQSTSNWIDDVIQP